MDSSAKSSFFWHAIFTVNLTRMEIYITIGIVFFFIFFTIIRKSKEYDDKLRQKLSTLGISDITQEMTLEKIKMLYQSGFKIQAIKKYRELTVKGLKESKEYLEEHCDD